MKITGEPPSPLLSVITGTAWKISIDGPIQKNAGEQLAAFIETNRIPAESFVTLNSNGGNLFGGMALGRVIRRHRLRTDVGVAGQEGEHRVSRPGACHSACSLAFLGGKFRYLREDSRFGVHRFSFASPQKNESDIAQITAAAIVTYLREMGIDPAFFALTTRAGPDGIYEPRRAELEDLGVVNNGVEPTVWSIESRAGLMYLKGERETVFGMNKFLLSCPEPRRMILMAIFDPQQREQEAMMLPAHSLVIDGKLHRIRALDKKIVNGWVNVAYDLTPAQLLAIQRAETVGVILRAHHDAPVFLGFDAMPLGEGSRMLPGLVNSCAGAGGGPDRPRSR